MTSQNDSTLSYGATEGPQALSCGAKQLFRHGHAASLKRYCEEDALVPHLVWITIINWLCFLLLHAVFTINLHQVMILITNFYTSISATFVGSFRLHT